MVNQIFVGGKDFETAHRFFIDKFVSACKRHLRGYSLFAYKCDMTKTEDAKQILEDILFKMETVNPIFIGDLIIPKEKFMGYLARSQLVDVEFQFHV